MVRNDLAKLLMANFVFCATTVLGRLKAFLPMMDEANQKLFSSIQEKGREEYDIEVVDDDENKPHIEMVRFYMLFSFFILDTSVFLCCGWLS